VNGSFKRPAPSSDLPSYFDTFGAIPALSRRAWHRMRERGVTRVMLDAALAAEPEVGTTDRTVLHRGRGITAVVNGTTGVIVTIWRTL